MNKKLLIIGGAILVVLAVVGGILFFINSGSGSNEDENGIIEDFRELSAEEIGVEISTDKESNEVIVDINKIEDIDTFEIVINYESNTDGEAVQDGAIASGPNEDEVGKDAYHREIYLGTCSRTCTPDEGIEEVMVEIRVDFKNGEVGLYTETLPFE